MQPRLGDARKLVAGGLVKRLKADGAIATFEVQGTGTRHRVTLAGEQESCTCPWFSKYLGQRGPCKHILAASLVRDGLEEASVGR